jgi:hypothetical protein
MNFGNPKFSLLLGVYIRICLCNKFKSINILLHVFVAAGTVGCLALRGEIHFIEPLHSNDMKDTHTYRHIDRCEGLKKYPHKMGLVMIYIPSFVITGLGIKKLMKRVL